MALTSLLIPTNRSWILIGAGGHAKVVRDLLLAAGGTIHGVVDRSQPVDPTWTAAWLGDDTFLESEAAGNYHFALCFVGLRSLTSRERVIEVLLRERLSFPALVHPRAVVAAGARVEAGVQVMAKATVQADASIGLASIINTAAVIEHDVQVEQNCHIASGAIICGGAAIAAGTIIGPGAIVAAGVRVGSGILFGAGSVVLRDTLAPGMYYGNPAHKGA